MTEKVDEKVNDLGNLIMKGIITQLDSTCKCEGCKVWKEIAKIVKNQIKAE